MPRGRAYRFVVTSRGQNPTTREIQRTVRSHAATVSRSHHVTRRPARARELNEGEGVIVFDTSPVNPAQERDPQQLPAPAQTDELTLALQRNPNPLPWRLYADYLSGDTFSPLLHLPTYHQPYLPGIINHYIYNLTIPVPELDGSSAVPLFRAAWLPVVFHDPLIFQVVVLFAATHYATFANSSQFNYLYLELLSLKQSALLALIQRVQGEQAAPSTSTDMGPESRNTLIAAAAKMASYEAIFGSGEAFHLHMSTVTRLLRLQGGLTRLGMNGFLARLLAFIDTNSAFLLGTNLYLVEFGLLNRMPPHQTFLPRRFDEVAPEAHAQIVNTNVVNLERFLGFMNISSENNEGSQPPSRLDTDPTLRPAPP